VAWFVLYVEDMRWLEEISVRTQPRREKEVVEFLLETAASVIRNEQAQSARVYSHHSAPGGFSLILFWNTASVPTQGSDTAVLILEGLKPLGLLNHTVLIERELKR
jgi:hypothetical protein